MILLNDFEFTELINRSTSFIEVDKSLYGYSNGKTNLKTKERIELLQLSVEHFDRGNSKKRKYQRIIKTCPVCKNDFKTIESNGTSKHEKSTCSRQCANEYFDHHPPGTNEKIRDSLIRFFEEKGINSRGNSIVGKIGRFCAQCGNPFSVWPSDKQECCSRHCSGKYKWSKNNYRNLIMSGIKERVENGTHSGWKSRSGKAPSYAEQFFIKVLNNNSISFKRELTVGRYFVDFAIITSDRKIALEIDGKQHELEERKLSDLKKDSYLISEGWVVHRIKWKNPNTETNKIYIKEEIDRLLNLYNQVVA